MFLSQDPWDDVLDALAVPRRNRRSGGFFCGWLPGSYGKMDENGMFMILILSISYPWMGIVHNWSNNNRFQIWCLLMMTINNDMGNNDHSIVYLCLLWKWINRFQICVFLMTYKMKMVFIYSYPLIDSYENMKWMFRDNWPIMNPIPTMVIVAMWNCQRAVMVIIQDRRDAMVLCCFFPSGKSTTWGIRRFFGGGISGGSFANPRMYLGNFIE